MRLRDYQDLIDRAIPVFEQLTIPNSPISGYPGMYLITNVQNFLKIAEELSKINLFNNNIGKLYTIPNFKNTAENTVTVNTQSKNLLNTVKTETITAMKLLQQTLLGVLQEEDIDTLNIKLPEQYSSIDDYISFFEDIKTICSPFKYINEEVVVSNFDVGTEWIGLKFIGSGAALFLSLADKGANLFHHVLECQKTIEELEKIKLDKSTSKLKIIEQTIEMLRADKENNRKAYIDQLIEEAINESKMVLNDDINKNEFKNYLRIALEKISSLLIQGMEIVPAIKAKPEIKQLSQKATQNIEEKRKLVIGCDNLKYLTLLNPTISAKDIPSDTLEMN